MYLLALKPLVSLESQALLPHRLLVPFLLCLCLEDHAEQREDKEGNDHDDSDIEQRALKTTAGSVHPGLAAEHAAQAAALALQDNQHDKRCGQDDLHNIEILSQLQLPPWL